MIIIPNPVSWLCYIKGTQYQLELALSGEQNALNLCGTKGNPTTHLIASHPALFHFQGRLTRLCVGTCASVDLQMPWMPCRNLAGDKYGAFPLCLNERDTWALPSCQKASCRPQLCILSGFRLRYHQQHDKVNWTHQFETHVTEILRMIWPFITILQ